MFADHEYDVDPRDGTAANLILSPAGKFAFAVFSAPDRVDVDDVGSPDSVSIETVPTDPLKMQAVIFPLTDVSDKVTLPPTIDPTLPRDKREQKAGIVAAWKIGAPLVWVESGRVSAPATETDPPSERARAATPSDRVSWLHARRDVVEGAAQRARE
jgi:hypothetical protein